MRTIFIVSTSAIAALAAGFAWTAGGYVAETAWEAASDRYYEWEYREERDTGNVIDELDDTPDFVEESPVPLQQNVWTLEWAEHDEVLDSTGVGGVQEFVQEGDTLATLAARNGLSVRDLCMHNDITFNRRLTFREWLYVVPVHGDRFWVVRPAQSLSEISAVTGVSVRDLADRNFIDDINNIEVGKVLWLDEWGDDRCC